MSSERETLLPFCTTVSSIPDQSQYILGLSGTDGNPVPCNYISVFSVSSITNTIRPSYFTVCPSGMFAGEGWAALTNFYTGMTYASSVDVSANSNAWWTNDYTAGSGTGGLVGGASDKVSFTLPTGMLCTSIVIRNDLGDYGTFAVNYGRIKHSTRLKDGGGYGGK
jgi:hypothetical protein